MWKLDLLTTMANFVFQKVESYIKKTSAVKQWWPQVAESCQLELFGSSPGCSTLLAMCGLTVLPLFIANSDWEGKTKPTIALC